MTEVDGELVGRGTSDIEGFMACVLEAAKYAAKIKDELKNPLYIATLYNEEIGCVGVRPLPLHLKSRGFKARGYIIGTFTEL